MAQDTSNRKRGEGERDAISREGGRVSAAHAAASREAGSHAAASHASREQSHSHAQSRSGIIGKIDALRGKGVRVVAGLGPRKPSRKPQKKRKPNPIARAANRWFDRVMGAVKDGGLSNQEEEYAAHRTTRDFVWNSIGAGSWGMVFPAVTMIATQVVGVEQAGMISMAFVVGILLMFVANFGVRTYQVSDVDEVHSFGDYQVNRVLTCILMVVIGIAYCYIRGYDAQMFSISMGVFLYKMIDGLADVYEGRLQQVDKLYLAGISQAFRSLLALAVFAVALLITRDAVVASYAMAVAAALTFVVITYPLTLLETPRSRRAAASSVVLLFKNTAPLFVGLFLFNLIDSMPKFVLEGMLTYDNQLSYNALYFPAQSILIMAQLVYKPLLVRMAGVWQDTSKRRQFDLILAGILAFIVALTAVFLALMAWVGVPVMSVLYGIDFEPMRGLLYIMLVAGGVTAAIDFLYQVITVMRRQKDVTALYCVTFGFSLFIPLLLVSFTGLPGAILSYLIVMSILFVLLVWEYLRIRRDLSRGRGAAQGAGPHQGAGSNAHFAQGAEGRASAHAEVPAGDEGREAVHGGARHEQSHGEPESVSAHDRGKAGHARHGQRSEGGEEKMRPSEVRARRLKREEVMNRRVTNRRS